MKLRSVTLRWFRGAAEDATLPLDGQCALVYGSNGAGKSSFVDAVEHVINDGKIGHLRHEHAGANQEKGCINTHRPEGKQTSLTVVLADGRKVDCNFRPSGSSVLSGDGLEDVRGWDYRRTILRQAEVTDFILATKGGKYSTLLPLLGLHEFEVCAENVHQLVMRVERKSNLAALRARIDAANVPRAAAFGTAPDADIEAAIAALHTEYCPSSKKTSVNDRCDELAKEITTRIASFSSENRRYGILLSIAGSTIAPDVAAVRAASLALASASDPLISQRLAILASTDSFLASHPKDTRVVCPACGTALETSRFRAHVDAEKARLLVASAANEKRRQSISVLVASVRNLKTELSKSDVKDWNEALPADLLTVLTKLRAFDADSLSRDCAEADLRFFDTEVTKIVARAATASATAPAEPVELNRVQAKVAACRLVIAAREAVAEQTAFTNLIAFLGRLEGEIRREVRQRAEAIIEAIGEDVRRMWGQLHPAKRIDGIHLYQSPDDDKAIDIGLTFHGVAQESPQLTLSEGFRNALGLCLFLAMAKRHSGASERPLILDDVVVSLDREHRGQVVALLQKEFPERQIVLLTHDRDWYRELRYTLKDSWKLLSLLPFRTPLEGIRWGTKVLSFDEAREHLDDNPGLAGQRARTTMDVELAIFAERLQLPLPYLRYEKNDVRQAKEFLDRLRGDSKSKLERRRPDGKYEPHPDAPALLEEADTLLLAWANRDTHTLDDGVRAEAERLIATCEKALDVFRCQSPTCGKWVWTLTTADESMMQCACGSLRWKTPKR